MQLHKIILEALNTLDLRVDDLEHVTSGGALFGEFGVLDSLNFLTLCIAVEEALEAIGHSVDAIGKLNESTLDRLKTVDDFAVFFESALESALKEIA